MAMSTDFNLEEEVGKVLGAWNPLSVPEFLALDEYRYYATQVASIGGNADGLRTYLKQLVGEKLSVGYDDANPEHRKDIERVVEELVQLFKKGGP